MSSVLLVMSLASCEKEEGVVVNGGEGSGVGGTTQTEEEMTGSPLTIGRVTIGGVEIDGITVEGVETGWPTTSGKVKRGLAIGGTGTKGTGVSIVKGISTTARGSLKARDLMTRASTSTKVSLIAYESTTKGESLVARVSMSKGNTVSAKGSLPTGRSERSRTTSVSMSKGIGIFRQPADGYSGERNNVEYTNGGSGWGAATGQKAVYLTKRIATLSVYYPYDSSCSDGKKTMSSCLSGEATDLCYEKGVSAKEGTAVTFNLGHAYARVEFVFSRAEVYDGSCAISGIGISDSNGKIVRSASLDLKSGQMSGQSYGSVSVNPGISGISAGNSATVEVLMVPTTGLGTMTLRFTVDGSEKTATVTSISELNGGKSYKINVEISASVVVQTAANCHIVAPGKRISIPVTVIGNGGATAGTVPSIISGTSINPASVGIVWETAKGLITLGSLSNGKVTVTAGSSAGNAVVAAYSGANQSGTILWSWHIWVTDYDPNTGTTYSVTNDGTPACTYVFMDRNLGATTATAGNAGTIGLHYQWGRKDPFTACSTLTPASNPNTSDEITVYNGGGTGFTFNNKSQTVSAANNLSNSIANPEVFYKGINNSNSGYDWYTATNSKDSQNSALWGGSDLATPGEKTIFDPCPAGWRVPAWSGSQSPWSAFTTSNFTWSNYGRTYSGSYYPAAGYRQCRKDVLNYTGSYGYDWSASPYSYNGYRLAFDNGNIYPSNYNYRASGLSVRCVKE
ncbi:MAG: fimbrillin family protein [Bacteroidales bacterium]|jgi:hypothetical protein|nr:fimbrillin family protein [Bacteroidales bacterium]